MDQSDKEQHTAVGERQENSGVTCRPIEDVINGAGLSCGVMWGHYYPPPPSDEVNTLHYTLYGSLVRKEGKAEHENNDFVKNVLLAVI